LWECKILLSLHRIKNLYTMKKTKIDYFKGTKTEWSAFFKKFHKSLNEAEAEAESTGRNVRYCEWYVTTNGDIDFEDVKPYKNGKVNWDGLNKQVAKFMKNAQKEDTRVLVEITSRDTTNGLLKNHYVVGDFNAIEG